MATFLFLPTFIFFYCVGESAALSTIWAREIAVSRCLLQKPRKQRLLRQIRMAMSSAFTLVAPHCSHQHRHHEFKGREINDLQKWRRGWDSNPRYGFPHARFRGECFQPLSHLSAVVRQLILAEGFVFRQSHARVELRGRAGGASPPLQKPNGKTGSGARQEAPVR